jgi:hypothetical protein
VSASIVMMAMAFNTHTHTHLHGVGEELEDAVEGERGLDAEEEVAPEPGVVPQRPVRGHLAVPAS